MENTKLRFLGIAYVLKLISKIFITIKVSMGVPLLDLCLVVIATQLSFLIATQLSFS